MDLYRKRTVLLFAAAAWIALHFVISDFLSGEIVTYISMGSFAAWFLLYIKWWRCPYCLSSLGRFQLSVIHCPACGKKIPKSGKH